MCRLWYIGALLFVVHIHRHIYNVQKSALGFRDQKQLHCLHFLTCKSTELLLFFPEIFFATVHTAGLYDMLTFCVSFILIYLNYVHIFTLQ